MHARSIFPEILKIARVKPVTQQTKGTTDQYLFYLCSQKYSKDLYAIEFSTIALISL